VPVTLEIWPDMFHVFQARYATLANGQQAVRRLGSWAAGHLGIKLQPGPVAAS
jgi:hypothetical protein